MQTSTKTKIPLFDALGLPFSPEISWETMASAALGAVKLTGESIKETAANVSGQKFDINGSINFQEGVAKTPELMQKEANESRRQNEFFRDTQQDLGKVAMEKGLAESLKAKREDVNKIIGIKNVSYEDTVNEDRTLRTDVAVEYEKKNSELATEQVKANRQNTVALAVGGKLGAKDYYMRQDMSGERTSQNVMSAVG